MFNMVESNELSDTATSEATWILWLACVGGGSPALAVLCAQSTLEACRDLNGRLFGGRLIHCCLYDNNRYFARMLDANKLLDPSRGLPQDGVGGPGIIFKAKSFKKF